MSPPSAKKSIRTQRKKERIWGSMLVLSLIILSVLIGGWYLFQMESQGSSSVEDDQSSTNGKQGSLAPGFSLTDLEGNQFQLSDFRGRVVVIDFMATWCGPCRQEMPHYGTIWEKYGDKIVLISIAIDPRESAETLGNFAQEFPYATWIWARDTANLGQVYQVTGIPKTVIIDQDGYIMFEHTGVTPATTFIIYIEELLREASTT